MDKAWARLKALAQQQAAVGADPTPAEAHAVVLTAIDNASFITRLPAEAVEFFTSEYVAMVRYYKNHPSISPDEDIRLRRPAEG